MLQVFANGLALGAAYALVALGFVLVVNATGAVNFAQGDLVMAGGFVAVALAGLWPVPGFALLPAVLVVMAGLGLILSAVAYFPLRTRPPSAVFVSTIAVGIMLENGANAIFGAEPRAAPALFGSGSVALGPVTLSRQAVAIIIIAAVLIVAQQMLFTRTRLGQRLRATAEDRDMAAAIGIDVNRMVALTFALATALGGAAGLLLANSFFVTPTDGTNYMLKAYLAVVIGGWGSVPGAVVGALLIALFEVAYPSLPLLVPGLPMSRLFSETTATVILYLVVLALLFFRPRGLLGEAALRRA
jgi:branched-chain amino acid transport system permease protein